MSSIPASRTAPRAWPSSPSRAIAVPLPPRIGARVRASSKLLWESKSNRDHQNPYQIEWDELLDAIRNDKPYNEAKRGMEASLVTSMGRMAAHTGQEVTFDDMLNCEHEMAPDVDKLTMDSPAPSGRRHGKYPVPQPGIVTKREYA